MYPSNNMYIIFFTTEQQINLNIFQQSESLN